MGDVAAADIAQLDAFEVLPEPLARVEPRRIGREALQVQALGGAMGEEVSEDPTAMDRRAVPDVHHPAWHFAQQVLETGDHLCGRDGGVLAVEVHLALGRDGRDGREMIAGAPRPQDRGLAHGRIGAHHAGQGIETGFVYEEDRLLLRLSPCLRAGQVSSRHWAIAASSRWRARRVGCCGLHRLVWQRRPTCRGW